MKKELQKMKGFIASALFSLIHLSVSAQNTFPALGPVGIGTTAPTSMLTIRPTLANAFDIHPATLSTTTGEFRLRELTANGSQYVGFKAPSSIVADVMWVLPSTLGTSEQVLSRGSGSSLVWSTVPALSLNNLSTTSVNVDLLPNTNGTRNLGSSTLRWNHGYFNGGVVVGNTTVTAAGMIRYNAGSFQGYNGSTWVNLGGGATGANTSLSNLSATSINADMIPSSSDLRSLGSNTFRWKDLWLSGELRTTGGITANTIYLESEIYASPGGETVLSYNPLNNNVSIANARIPNFSSSNNIFIGPFAGNQLITGSLYDNICIGTSAGTSLNQGNVNTIIGTFAGVNVQSGSGNTMLGYGSGEQVTSGFDNTIIGMLSGTDLSSGSKNAFLGREAGNRINDGVNNVCIGNGAAPNLSTPYNASGLTLLGANAQTNGAYNNAAAIGNSAVVNASNRVRIGNAAITRISGQVGFSIDSDRRLKQNVKDYALGLEFINKLRPVSYEYTTNPEGGNRQGFIAQEVEEALGKTPFEGLSRPEHEADYYAINYAAFVVPLVNAVKELTEKVNALEAKLEAANNYPVELHNRMIQRDNQTLGQNEPNPFEDFSRIHYDFNKNPAQGRILIIDMNGRNVQTYTANAQQGVVMIQKGQLAPGVYTYMLMDGNEFISSKQMIVK
jgi:hypothetical protein